MDLALYCEAIGEVLVVVAINDQCGVPTPRDDCGPEEGGGGGGSKSRKRKRKKRIGRVSQQLKMVS